MAPCLPVLATANDIAALFPQIPLGTIRWYAYKGWITRCGWELPDRKGARLRPTYDVRQVLAVRQLGGPEPAGIGVEVRAA